MIKKPAVKKMLGIPDMPPPPPPSASQLPNLSIFESLKKYAAAQQQMQSLSEPPEEYISPPSEQSPDEAPKPVRRRTPSSALSRRIRNLEKEVKGRKKGIKRASK